jgi:tetratricopeptide (TPR) repeat protein
MNHRTAAALFAVCALLGLTGARGQAPEDFDAELKSVRDAWAIANYRTPEDQRLKAFEKLIIEADAFAAKYPTRPEALIWDGIVLSTYAGVKGGIGALTPAKQAKARFEAALAIDEQAMDGSAHTSLGTLYHKVPGFPIAFGSDRKAREHLEKAIQIAPKAIDTNYFYGEFLYDEGEYAQALQHLDTALQAPPRPGREIADAGRRAEIQALVAKTKEEMD